MRARDLLVGIALRLGFAPFTWLFRAFEALAIRCSVRSVRAVPGVVAIYLAGSRARGESLPGLSDIDFKIFVRGPRNRSTPDEIRHRFSRLRRFFPMLGPPDEKGVHFVEGFAADLERQPLLRHLFDPRCYRHRLLWGDPVLERLAPARPEGESLRQALLWRLKDWVEKASVLAEHPVLAPAQRRYLLWKAVADAGFVLLVAGDNERQNEGRTAVLRELATRPDDGVRLTLRKLLAEREIRFQRPLAAPDEVWQLFLRLVGEALAALGYAFDFKAAPPPPRPTVATDIPADVPGWLREALPAGALVADLPWRRIPLSPLDCGFFGRRLLLLTLPEPLSLAGHVRLRTAARAHRETTPVMIRETGWLRSAFCDLLDHWLSPAAGDDLTLALASAEMPPPPLIAQLGAKLVAWQEELEQIIADPSLARMDRPRYLRFLFAAMAGLVLCRSLDRGAFCYPSDPRGVAEVLRRETPLAPSFIALLEEEWQRVEEAGLPFREALFPKTRLLLQTWAGLLRQGESLERLALLNETPDLARATISVVVTTRNRCDKLARCLFSLAHQERYPDELLVVDNGSTDDTVRAVARFQADFPVRLVPEPVVGVAAARNRGLREARGEMVAFIDDDAVAESGWLAAVEEAFLRDERIGIVGGSILNLDTGATDAVSRFFELVERLPA
jgi:predicted nucleotidyltransferase